jgi:ABC-2 type transport system ATP-binding protein
MTEHATNGIEARGLERVFKGGVVAVDGIDLDVRPGEIYGFLGPNGAGKSTTVHMLTTLMPPTAGTARVAGYDVVTEGALVRDVIGAALQEAALDPNLSAREHMRLQGALHGIPKTERTRRGDALIERVGLANAADRKVATYSGGMRRRLDLALALLHEPRVLFLDEPTTGLDIQSRTALWEEVAHLSRDLGVTVFLTTQYLEEADQLASRLGIIDRGRIVAEGTPQALKDEIGRPTVEAIPAEPADRERTAGVLARFGELVPGSPSGAAVRLRDGADELTEIVRGFDAEGVRIANLQLHTASLNDVFLAKTGRSLEGAQAQAAEESGAAGEPALEEAAA